MPLPDPFMPNLKVDLLPEIRQPPRILSNYEAGLTAALREAADLYIANRGPPALLDTLVQELQLPVGGGADGDAGAGADGGKSGVISYNVHAINALVMYVGVSGINQAGLEAAVAAKMTDCAQMDIFVALARRLQPQGRYMFLNAAANQLRFPSNHTNYFSCTLLHLFCECTADELVLEQISRVLLERLVVNRPHPWGLMITFIELVQNSRYNFWGYDFTVKDPEVRRLVESVARSCVGPAPIAGASHQGFPRQPGAPN